MPKKLKVKTKGLFVGIVCERIDSNVVCSFCWESKPCARSPITVEHKTTTRTYIGLAYLKQDTTAHSGLFGTKPRTVDEGAKEIEISKYEERNVKAYTDICKDCATQISKQL